MRSTPSVCWRLAVSLSRSFVAGAAWRPSLRSSWISGRARISAGRPRSSASPRLGKLSLAAVETVPSPLIRSVHLRRGRAQVAQQRRALNGQLVEVDHQRLELAQELGQQVDPAADVAAALGRGLAGRVGLDDPVGHLAALARQRAQRLVGVARQVGERAVLLGQDREQLVGLAQGRVGAVDDLVQLVAAPGQAGAELAQQDREALAVGQPQDVVEQVDVDGRAGVRPAAAAARPRRRRCRSARATGPTSSRARTRRTSRRSGPAAESRSWRPTSRG